MNYFLNLGCKTSYNFLISLLHLGALSKTCGLLREGDTANIYCVLTTCQGTLLISLPLFSPQESSFKLGIIITILHIRKQD